MKSKFKVPLWLLIFALISCSSLKVDQQELERITHQEKYEESLAIKDAEIENLGKKIEDLQQKAPPSITEITPPKPAEPEAKAKAPEPEKKPEPAPAVKEEFMGPPAPEEDVPFRVGENVTLSLKYFGLRAGDLSIRTMPVKLVNGELSYHFRMDAVSNRSFAFIYSVNDYAETFVGVKGFRPFNYLVKMEQKDRAGENKALFDWKKLKGYTWERAITKKGEEKKDYEWKIRKGSQNVISALYFVRMLDLEVGKQYQVPLAHRGKNLDMTILVEKKEVIKTAEGKFETIVIVPSFELDGAFKQVGDIRIWLTDDSQKLPLQIQAKIKIGTINATLKSLERGQRL